MSVFNQTYKQSSYIKDLASSQGYGVRLLYDSNKSSLSQRFKDLVSNQGFNVGIQSNI